MEICYGKYNKKTRENIKATGIAIWNDIMEKNMKKYSRNIEKASIAPLSTFLYFVFMFDLCNVCSDNKTMVVSVVSPSRSLTS